MTFRLALIVFFSLPASASEWFEGENLLTNPIPNVSEYEEYSKNEPGWTSRLWQRKGDEGDTFVVNIVEGGRANLKKFRESQDLPGQQSCQSFSSDLLSDEKRNGYKSVSWETYCQIGESEITSIQLAIAGRDSLYHVRKLWKSPVNSEVKNVWEAEIAKISLCDTRKKKHPCPEGYSRQDDT